MHDWQIILISALFIVAAVIFAAHNPILAAICIILAVLIGFIHRVKE